MSDVQWFVSPDVRCKACHVLLVWKREMDNRVMVCMQCGRSQTVTKTVMEHLQQHVERQQRSRKARFLDQLALQQKLPPLSDNAMYEVYRRLSEAPFHGTSAHIATAAEFRRQLISKNIPRLSDADEERLVHKFEDLQAVFKKYKTETKD